MSGDLDEHHSSPEVESEMIWTNLQALVADGVRVERNVSIAGVVAPFAVLGSKVAIDIDAPTRGKAALKRAERDLCLVRAGWRVLTLPKAVAQSQKALSAQIGNFLKVLGAADETRGKH